MNAPASIYVWSREQYPYLAFHNDLKINKSFLLCPSRNQSLEPFLDRNIFQTTRLENNCTSPIDFELQKVHSEEGETRLRNDERT